ncbi:MAG: hypothetical protein V1811_02355 [Candidatus Micrarchaeota archaeon]
MNKTVLLIAGLALLLAVLLAVQNNVFTPKPEQTPQATPTSTPISCANGAEKSFSCEGNTLTFLKCENGAFAKKTRDCGNAKCMATVLGVACVEDLTPYAQGTGGQGNQTATPSKTPGDKLGGFCGDGVCAVNETCASCVEDCACKQNEFCDTRYGAICRPIDACGDGICSTNEKQNANCCQDCGCTTGTICPIDNGKCVIPLKLNQTSINAALAGRFPSGFRIISTADTSIGGKVFKEILVIDSSNATLLVFVNASAKVEAEAVVGISD